MHPEAERLLTKVSQVKNHAEGGKLVQKATRYMTHMEKSAKQDELSRVKETLAPSNVALGALTQEGRVNLTRYKNYLQEDLKENVAPEVSPEVRDDLIKAEHQLAGEIRQGMLPHEVMRRNPPGAVGAHIKWERENKARILAYKNLRRLNHPDDDSEDLANIEMLRPYVGQPGTAATFIADAQIPGNFAMSPLAKENWPENMPEFGTANSALKQAEERELREQIAELKAQLTAKEQSRSQKKARSAANRAEASIRMKKYWADRRAKEHPLPQGV